MKKRILSLLLALLLSLSLFLFAACGLSDNGKIQIVCTSFAEYDWVKHLVGERADKFEITYLLDNGVDIHSYEPSTADIAKIANCDLFLYVGGAAEDSWVGDALAVEGNEGRKTLSLLSVIGEDAICPDGHAHEDGHAHAADEHVFLSLRCAVKICEEIAAALISLDPDGEAAYTAALTAYKTELLALDAEYESTVTEARHKALVIADRNPFSYLARDYGLTVHAAVVGCSTDADATFDTPIRLASALDSTGVGSILVLDGTDDALARTAIAGSQSKNQVVRRLDSLQSVTKAELDAGITYLSVMRENLAVLSAALN